MTKKAGLTPQEIADAADDFGKIEVTFPTDAQPFDAGPDDVPAAAMVVLDEGTHEMAGIASYHTAGLDSSDIAFPLLRLAQGLTAEVQSGGARPGQWISQSVVKDRLTVIPLMYARKRELRNEDRGVLCRSEDSVVGVGVPGGVCATCPMSQWSDGPDGRRQAPPCNFFYSYIVYIPDDGGIAMLNFKRTAVNVGKSINTMFALNGAGNFAVELGSNKNTNARGTFYVPTASKIQVSPELLEEARSMI